MCGIEYETASIINYRGIARVERGALDETRSMIDVSEMLTQPGLATIASHEAASQSPLMRHLIDYSRSFRRRCGTRSGPAAAYWRYDPMDHGMRRWEYPFLIERLSAHCAKSGLVHVLDAGAGMTCIPFFIAERFENVMVQACDMDPNLPEMYAAIQQPLGIPVIFTDADMRELPYGEESFDLVYCISVLEHTDEYEKIIREFHRVLKPGGRLILTFDISLDGRTDIDCPRGDRLVESLVRHFEGVPIESLIPLSRHASTPGVMTTDHLRNHAPDLLPWHMTPRIFLGALRRFKIPKTPFFSTAVCGLDLTKSEPQM